ncbi:uncharacterized protein [Nicotiana tomentosiformis]|uniref:uncharacterized protein n=1 Tax=Nicotiana tomentosiformis TaxID=4098 RepID=UPI00388CE041
MDHFLPAETRAGRAAEFENLKQGSKSLWEYHMEFAHLSKYAILMLPTMEARVRRFVQGLSPLIINEAAAFALNSDMNYGKMVALAQATEDHKLKNRREREGTSKSWSAASFGESLSGGKSAFRGESLGPSQSFAQSSASAPLAGSSQEQGVISGPVRVAGDPTSRADQEGDSSSSGAPHALGMGRCTQKSATWTHLYVMGAD